MADAEDKQTGISIRFIKEFKADRSISEPVDIHTKAMSLAFFDERELPFAEKIADAMAFLRSQIH